MAPSFRDLIDFILAEIALCGARGAASSDILEFANAFYTKTHASKRNHAVDRRFQEKVWSWLARNPEVSVGRDKEGNHLSLSEVERLAHGEASDQLAPEGSLPIVSHSEDGSSTANAQSFRVFVSEERTWLAITGHEPDDTKVLPTEFALLSVIASAKSSGIIQPDLVRLSGQDKRSIPKRTDELHRKGYIEKRPIQVKGSRGMRTSLCTLRRFSQENAALETAGEAGDMIDFEAFLGKLFDVLKEYKLISRNDLKKVLGFTDTWRWRFLSRAIRKFERIGVLKRVRAPSQYANREKSLHSCVLLVRPPSERDFDAFHEFRLDLPASSKAVSYGELDEENDDPEPDDVDLVNGGTGNVIKQEDGMEEAGRTLPSWNPDRNASNQIFDTVDRAGTLGMTSQNVLRSCFGSFFRKPLENTLIRLVDCWQLSQPPHLRHLAIVRDTTILQRLTHYVYYSAGNFERLVETGQSAWEAVEYVPRGGRADPSHIPAVNATAHLNSYELPQFVPANELLKNGNAALLECVSAAKPENYWRSGNELTAVHLEDGTYTLDQGHVPRRAQQHPQDNAPVHPRGRPKSTPNRPKPEHREIPDSRMDDVWDVDDSMRSRPKKPTRDDRLAGLPEKERLEALGMDQSWTEYSVLLMERPNPGVYLTPQGKRRPAGKRQGRPRISRLAVFKSPKLASFPWFRSEIDEAARGNFSPRLSSGVNGAEHPADSPICPDAGVSARAPDYTDDRQRKLDEASQITTTPRKPKRSKSEVDSFEAASASAVGTSSMTEGGRSKRQRLNDPEDKTAQDLAMPSTGDAEDPQPPNDEPSENSAKDAVKEASASRSKRKRSIDNQDRAVEAPEVSDELATSATLATSPETKKANDGKDPEEGQEPLAKRRRHEPEIPGDIPAETAAERATNDLPALASATVTNPDTGNLASPAEGDDAKPVEESRELSGDQSHRPFPEAPRRRVRRMNTDRTGSVALLRRKIIMDIVDKAGGAFPWGAELWNPFAAAWAKMKYKGVPDMRTVKATGKHLIDAGKLRQMTFSGKDSKEVMVTKSIITKPDLEPNDPVIKRLQENMLAEPKFYIPPNTEVDPTLHRRGAGRKPTEHPKAGTALPVETGMTVQLHGKPAVVMQGEKRRGRRIQRELLRSIEPEPGASKQGVTRLMSIYRPLAPAPTSISRPRQGGDEAATRAPVRHRARKIPQDGIHRARRLWHPISTIAPYAMFLNPSQTFHASTGTFSTDAGVAALQEKRAVRDKRTERLPESLDDLLKKTKQRKRPALSESLGPDASRFFSESDAILRWELCNEEALRERCDDLRYINQTIGDRDTFEAAGIEGDIHFVNEEEEQPLAPAAAPMATRRRARRRSYVSAADKARPSSPPPLPADSEGVLGAEELQDIQEDEEGLLRYPAIPKRKRPATAAPQIRRLTKLNESLNADEPGTAATAAPIQRHITRRRFPAQLGPSMGQRLMTAIVVLRSLAGGLEGKIVDWSLMPSCFPGHDPKFIQERGKSLLGKNRLQLAKMQSDFQERFVEAYARNEVPRIDYGNLEGYDWPGVVDWAYDNLEAPASQKLPDLPATREQFDSLFELREEVPPGVDELYQTTSSATIARKRALQAGVAFAVPLPRAPKSQKAGISRLEAAKTWIRANVTTPEETYQSGEAWEALRRFDNPLMESALQSLVTDRVISMGNRGRITPGRNYDITDNFLSTLGRRRVIEHTQLRRAARFKTKILDPELQARGSLDVSYHAEDGDILSLINLAAAGKVSLKPRDPPNDKFGFTEGSYVTRQLDKEKLRFSIEVQPIAESYVYGNPLQERMSTLPAPCPRRVEVTPSVSLPEVIPIWFDIHGQFNKLLWEQVAAAVVGCVATRPGINAAGIANMIKPAMGTWEVQMLLEWMAEVGIARQGSQEEGEKQRGWRVEDWWWMILG